MKSTVRTGAVLTATLIMGILLGVFGNPSYLSDIERPSDVYQKIIDTFWFPDSRDEREVTPELRPVVSNLAEKTETGALIWTPSRYAWEATTNCCIVSVGFNRELWANFNVTYFSEDLQRDVTEDTGDVELGLVSQDLVDLLEARFPRRMPEKSKYSRLALECLSG